MKEIYNIMTIIPITVLIMFFLSESEVREHARLNCIFYFINLLMFLLLYVMCVILKIKKWICLTTMVILFMLLFIFKKYVSI